MLKLQENGIYCFIPRIKSIFIIFLFLLTAIPLLYSQNSEIINLPDGYYIYSINRTRDAKEVEEIYKQSGADINIDVMEDFSQLAIMVKNRSFTDPSLGVTIIVDNNGNLTSPDSPDLQGKFLISGNLSWSGTVKEGEYFRYVENICKLIPISNKEKADPSYNGNYLLAAEVFDQEMKLVIRDGLLTFEWIDSDQFKELYGESAYLVSPDGSFGYTWEMLLRMTMNVGTYESITDSITTIIQEGRISPGGIIFNYITRTSSGTDTLGWDDRQVYAGMKISGSEHSNGDSDVLQPSIIPPDRSESPTWYISPESQTGYLVSSGSHSHIDKETALRLAEITASSNLSYQIQTNIRAFFNTYQKSSEMNNITINVVTEIIEQISTLFFPVTVDKSFFNHEKNTAYVLVSISEEQKDAVIRQLFNKNQIDPEPFIE